MDEQQTCVATWRQNGSVAPADPTADAADGPSNDGLLPRLVAVAPPLLIFAAAQFLVVSALAMIAYHGGTEAKPLAGAYSFTHNFFSDLGALAGYDGQAQTLPNLLFTYGLVCVGFALALFGLAVPRMRTSRKGRVAAALAPVAAAISGASFVGIATTPKDVALAAHLQFVDLAFGLLLVFILCLVSLEIRGGWPPAWVLPNLLYVVVLAAYVWLLFWGPSTDSESGLVIQVVAQKVIVYGSIVNIGWQAVGFWQRLRDRPV